ncbi:MAG: 5-formyltetrahydrofolate cyclo-ligase [Cystobacterineae bacterium]|nr:5-formyltetrahydrofolate cyclo-ligase [Cystobacterineae bacterium]
MANKGLLLFAQLLNLPHWHSARCVALYAAQPFEVPTSKLFETLWGIHKHTCFPAPGLHAPSLALVSSLEDLAPGPYGILFPKPHCPPVAMANVELILVPGLAFAKNGARLGRGGGFYDKLLAAPEMKALRVGLCFEEYLVENLPEEAHDVRMHWVVTDKQCLRCLPTPP